MIVYKIFLKIIGRLQDTRQGRSSPKMDQFVGSQRFCGVEKEKIKINYQSKIHF